MKQPFRTERSDALVVGGGITGLIAALKLAEAGIRVRVLSTGLGASPYVTGFEVPVCPGDSMECFLEDVARSGCGQGSKELEEILCRGSEKVIPFLRSIGFEFDEKDGRMAARQPVGASFPRVIGHGNTSGVMILNLVEKRLKELPAAELSTGVRALRLLKNGNRIAGAFCYDENTKEYLICRANQVLLACGGFSKLYPFSTNTKDIAGDGPAMAYLAGAELTDMEFVQFEPSVAVWPEEIRGKGMITTLFFEGAVMKNGNGERFMLKYGPQGEQVNKDVLGKRITEELLAGNGTPHGGVWFDATAVKEERLHEAYEYFMKRYRDVGIDLSKTPVELAPAPHTSLGGIRIDGRCRTAVEGLYAAGEAAGHIHGANRIGGNAGLEILVFGAIAGEEMVKYAGLHPGDADPAPETDELTGRTGTPMTAERLREIRKAMEELLQENLWIFRNGEGLARTARQLEQYAREVSGAALEFSSEGALDTLRLENDLLTAWTLALSALNRDSSVGCHNRTDAPEAPEEPYQICLKNGGDLTPVVTRVPV